MVQNRFFEQFPIKYLFSLALSWAYVSSVKVISLNCCFNIYSWQVDEEGPVTGYVNR